MTREQKKAIEKMVYERFPITKGEMKCRDEKREMDEVRMIYRKKLIEQLREKIEY